ncbi:alkaline phosphatase D family protein [Litoreibacter sp.]|nr:alkaline phosphatase D family protein [Litoreibacter sp.]
MPEPKVCIAFTSCCHHKRKEQPAWAMIAARKPDLLLLLGDTVYAQHEGWHIDDLGQKYRDRLADPQFRSAIDTIPTLATWDDHDLGPNNAMGDSPEARTLGATGLERRQEARLLFHSHLAPRGVSADALDQPAGEIYCSYALNGVLVIVLDGRYYRQNIREVGANAAFLGAQQEAWLWQQFERAKNGEFLATVVCCGSTIDSNNELGEDISHYRAFYPEFARRFRDCPNPIFLSGDIHRSAFVRHEGFVEGIASGVAQIRPRTVSEEFPDGLEEINNWGELVIYDDCARFEYAVTDYGVIEERFPITGVSKA